MAFATITPATTGQTMATQLDDLPRIWEARAQQSAENADFWNDLEGGEASFIVSKTDLAAQAKGHKIIMRVESGYYNEPHLGEDDFADETHYEGDEVEDYELRVDFIRHASSKNVRAASLAGFFQEEFKNNTDKKLGRWLGRYRSEQMDMLFREKINSENLMRPNGKLRDTLVAADGLSFNAISTAQSYLSTMCGPAVAGTYGGGKAKAMKYMLVAPKAALTVLKQDAGYQSMIASAGTRGAMNPYFSGEFTDLDGVLIKDRNVLDHDGIGAIGSPLNPRARLGTAISAGTTVVDITGGGAATSASVWKHFFKYFPNMPYKFSSYGSGSGASVDTSSVLAQDALTHYVLIYNVTGADAGKFGMYSYTTGNNGNKITTVNRLGSAASGARVTTLGDVVWNTGIWSGKHTDTHPVGSLVIPCNSKGEPIGWSYLLGHAAAFRGYGLYKAHRASEEFQAGFGRNTYIWSVFGQILRQTRDGRHPGIVTIQHALHYKELPLPTIV